VSAHPRGNFRDLTGYAINLRVSKNADPTCRTQSAGPSFRAKKLENGCSGFFDDTEFFTPACDAEPEVSVPFDDPRIGVIFLPLTALGTGSRRDS
jgi:hypothetical protein